MRGEWAESTPRVASGEWLVVSGEWAGVRHVNEILVRLPVTGHRLPVTDYDYDCDSDYDFWECGEWKTRDFI
jgi:hypothetical protein